MASYRDDSDGSDDGLEPDGTVQEQDEFYDFYPYGFNHESDLWYHYVVWASSLSVMVMSIANIAVYAAWMPRAIDLGLVSAEHWSAFSIQPGPYLASGGRTDTHRGQDYVPTAGVSLLVSLLGARVLLDGVRQSRILLRHLGSGHRGRGDLRFFIHTVVCRCPSWGASLD